MVRERVLLKWTKEVESRGTERRGDVSGVTQPGFGRTGNKTPVSGLVVQCSVHGERDVMGGS